MLAAPVIRRERCFPRVVSDFSLLIDAIECGIVKVPRVPVSDDSMVGDVPTYRDLRLRVRDNLPEKGRKTDAISGGHRGRRRCSRVRSRVSMPTTSNTSSVGSGRTAQADGSFPPVFIVVCNDTNVSKLVFDYITGCGKELKTARQIAVPPANCHFLATWKADGLLGPAEDDSRRFSAARVGRSHVGRLQVDCKVTGSRRISRPSMRAVSRPRRRGLTDEGPAPRGDDTVGKRESSANRSFVVSVSMLAEGWDANTVITISSASASLALNCCANRLFAGHCADELHRRAAHGRNADRSGSIEAFPVDSRKCTACRSSFIPSSGAPIDPKPRSNAHPRAGVPERAADCEITSLASTAMVRPPRQRVEGEEFSDKSRLALSTADLPHEGASRPDRRRIGDSHARRPQTAPRSATDLGIARALLEHYFRDDDGNVEHGSSRIYFPSLASRVKSAYRVEGQYLPRLLILIRTLIDATDRIYKAIVAASRWGKASTADSQALRRPRHDKLGPLRHGAAHIRTDPKKCHVSHVVGDTDDWEQKLARTLEDMPEVIRYVKNDHLGFTIPYTLNGQPKNYTPDFIVYLDDQHGRAHPLQLIVEVSGEPRQEEGG